MNLLSEPAFFGARLRRVRDAHRLLQRDVAERLSITPQDVSQIERGQYLPNDAHLSTLQHMFPELCGPINGQDDLLRTLEAVMAERDELRETVAQLKDVLR